MNTEILCVARRKPANPSWNILRHHHVSGQFENGLKGGSTYEAKCGVAAAFFLLCSCSLFHIHVVLIWWLFKMSWWVNSMQWSRGVKLFEASKCQITSVGEIRKIWQCVCVHGGGGNDIVLRQPWQESSRAVLAGGANVLFCSQWMCHACTAGPSENKSGHLSSG